MELATASTLAYISPVLITLLSIPILKHQVGLWRWLAVIIGFVGVVMIMGPGTDDIHPYSLLPIGAAFGYSLSTVCVSLFDDHNPTALLNMYASVGALARRTGDCHGHRWLPPKSRSSVTGDCCWYSWGWSADFAVLALINAYRLARPSSLSPYEYFGIPFAFLLGWLFFDEAPFEKLIPRAFS